MSIDHTEKGPGPKSTHARTRDAAAPLAEAEMSSDPEKGSESDALQSQTGGVGREADLNAPKLPHQQGLDGAADAPVAVSTSTGGR